MIYIYTWAGPSVRMYISDTLNVMKYQITPE